jgi:hypothetical protein
METEIENSHPERGHPDDSALIADSCQEPERFGLVFDRHATAIHGYVARRLGRDAADDVATDRLTVSSALVGLKFVNTAPPGRVGVGLSLPACVGR